MMDTDDCHRHAAECERLAEIANNPKIKQELRALAQEWRQIDVSESSEKKNSDGTQPSQQTVLKPHRVSAGEG
jgi:hypothetical protein